MKTHWKLFFIALFIFVHKDLQAEYSYLKLSQVISMSDYCAMGTIVKLDQNYFFLKVEKYVFTSLPYDTLKIRRFQDWSCGQRISPYAVGQKELVFFLKSNEKIPEFDFILYGGGGESELQIRKDSAYYQRRFNLTERYSLHALLDVLCDALDFKVQHQGKPHSQIQELLRSFQSKSAMHQQLITNEKFNWTGEPDLRGGAISCSLELQVLFRNTPNRVYIKGDDILFLSMMEGEVEEKEKYYLVTPHDKDDFAYLNIYRKETEGLVPNEYRRLFDILDLPEPDLILDNGGTDSLVHYPPRYISAKHIWRNALSDGAYPYQVLAYTITVQSGNAVFTRRLASTYFTPEVINRMEKLLDGDLISVTDVQVLYPDETVHYLKGRRFLYCPYPPDN
ncbi:MAG: hypothetical protein WBP58_03660 [Chitinophagaceae bacterium]